jgi:hypothetical protein
MMGFEEARSGALAITVPAAASFINFLRDFFTMAPLDYDLVPHAARVRYIKKYLAARDPHAVPGIAYKLSRT